MVGEWQPIETAPKKFGVLTEEGYVDWIHDIGFNAGWYQPNSEGDGMDQCYPKWWIELPPTPNPTC